MDQHLLEKRVSDALRFLRNQKEQLSKLRSRVEQLENTLELCLGSDEAMWLFRNRSERMDPTVPIFDRGRSEFHVARYRFAAERVAGQNVVDIACGTGYGCRILREIGNASKVTGIDVAEDALAYARKAHCLAGIEYLLGDVTNIPLESGCCDVVISFETIEHIGNSEQAVLEFARVLRPGGTLICSTPNNWPLEVAPHHKRVFDRDSFRALLASQFGQIEMYNQNSGTDFAYNREQPAGIIKTTDHNHEWAECFLAVCGK